MRLALLGLLLGGAGCSLAVRFDECLRDSECPTPAGEMRFCTSDHLCVSEIPMERLCVEPYGSSAPDATVLAGLFSLTNASGVTEQSMANGARLGIEEIAPFIKRPLRLLLCDTAGEPVQARRALIQAARMGAVGIVGLDTSSEVVEAYPAAMENQVAVVSPSATSPSITDLADDHLVWRTAASDKLQSKVMAQEEVPAIAAMLQVPVTSVVLDIVHPDSVYGVGLKTALVDSLFPLNVMPKRAYTFTEGAADAPAIVASLAADNPHIAVIIAYEDAPAIVAALSNAGPALEKTIFLMTDGGKTQSLWGDMPDPKVLSRIRGTAPATPEGAVFTNFSTAYRSKFHGEDPAGTAFVANTYDAFYALAIAVGGIPVGTRVTGPLLATTLARLSSGEKANVGPGDYVKATRALLDGNPVNLEGSSGPIDFDPMTGDVISAPIETWTIDTSTMPPQFKTIGVHTPAP